MSDRIFGVFGVLLAIGYAVSALAIEESFLSDAVGPKAFPLIIAAILGISSAVIAIKPDPEPHWPDIGRLVEIAAAVVVMVLYAEFLPIVGFVIATALAATYLAWRLGSTIIGSSPLALAPRLASTSSSTSCSGCRWPVARSASKETRYGNPFRSWRWLCDRSDL